MRMLTLLLMWMASVTVLHIVGWIITMVMADSTVGPVEFIGMIDAGLIWQYSLVVMLLATAQVAFVAPLVGPLRLRPTGSSLRSTILGASVFAGILTYVVLWGLIQIPDYVLAPAQWDLSTRPLGPSWPSWLDPLELLPIAIGWLALSAIWTGVLWKAGESRDPDGVARLARATLAGTAIELVLSIPLYILFRRKTDCYCGLGSFWGIVLGIVGLVWLCGPWCVLLLTREDRRNWARGACSRCGSPKRGGSSVCRECGA